MSGETRSDVNDDKVECPGCGKMIHDLCDLDISSDEEHTETECEACCRTIRVRVRLSRYFVATIL
jgi:DNA-directed RNA polymerase subunit RPC12/RpoP